MNGKPPTFIANFANADQAKVAQILSVTGPNFYMEEEARDFTGNRLPHAFSVWSLDGRKVEFWAIYESMFPDESIDDILTKWGLGS